MIFSFFNFIHKISIANFNKVLNLIYSFVISLSVIVSFTAIGDKAWKKYKDTK